MQTILVVDDVPDNITLLTFELEDDGFIVVPAASGHQCLEIAKKLPSPDLILLDIHMPEISGIETLKKLKEDQHTADIPVIMVSANDAHDTVIEAIDYGAHDFVSKPIEYPVLAARMRSALRLSDALRELERANFELNKLATTDFLTNLYNRRHFFDLAEKEFSKAFRHNRPLALMMMDIDHFKQVNDNHSHSAGDKVIQEIAKCCTDICRNSDIIGRVGGEEFALCCPDADLDGAHKLAERIRKHCEKTKIVCSGNTLSVTVSIGVTTIKHGEDFDDAMHRADLLLYKAKQSGRNQTIASMSNPPSAPQSFE